MSDPTLVIRTVEDLEKARAFLEKTRPIPYGAELEAELAVFRAQARASVYDQIARIGADYLTTTDQGSPTERNLYLSAFLAHVRRIAAGIAK